jgi:RNA-directed DNA polymerase
VIAKAQNTPLDKVRVLQRSLYRAAKANPKRKFGVLYDKVCREDVLRAAYLRSRPMAVLRASTSKPSR